MNNSTAEQAIRKVANSLINTHRPQLGACHSTAVEASLEALAELADELSLLDIYAELTKRLEILQGGQATRLQLGGHGRPDAGEHRKRCFTGRCQCRGDRRLACHVAVSR